MLEGLDALTSEDRRRINSEIARYVEALEKLGPPDKHPFAGTKQLDLQPTDLQRLARELDNAISAAGSS